MKKYMVTLKPVDCYFFGGEVTFGNGTTQNYLVRSNLLPQASALLGLMRYEVLRKNDLLSYNPKDTEKLEKVKQLIGNEGGFTLKDAERTYGVIQSISPVFLYHSGNNHYYTVERVDSKVKMNRLSESAGTDTPAVVSVNKDNRFICSYTPNDVLPDVPETSSAVSEAPEKKQLHVTAVPEFNEKNYDYATYWCDKQGKRLIVDGDVFSVNEQIGIKKNGKGRNDQDAFFKQELVTLHPDLCMAFTVEMADDKSLEEGSRWVFLGGNRSIFQMNIQPLSDPYFDFRTYFKSLHVDGSLLALGDALIPDTNRCACSFIWGICKPCRYMENAIDEQHNWSKPVKSNVLYHLQQRGSVIYAEEDELKDLVNLSFQQVGLNYFV